MSLGGVPATAPTRSSQAVNRLSAQYGTLFVIAAGNAGQAPRRSARPAPPTPR